MNRHCNRVIFKVFSVVVCVALLVGVLPILNKPPFFSPAAPLSPIPALAQTSGAPVATASIISKPTADSKLDSADGKVSVLVPAGAADEDLRIEYKQFTPPDSEGMRFIKTFELKAYATKRGDAVVSQFKKYLTITLKHGKYDLGGIDLNTLRLYYLDEATRNWVPQTSQFDPETQTLTVITNHFTQEGEIGASLQSGPGRVMAFQTDLHSGTATASYPIEIPDGPGGLKPTINLVYNSGGADEMKDKRATGAWVGIGWTLHLDRISYDAGENKYYLDFAGGSYELAYETSEQAYYTIPDQSYKLVTVSLGGSALYWKMWDKNGTAYRFGYNSDSRQSTYDVYSGATTYYRWDVDLIQDTHTSGGNYLNRITVDYVQSLHPDGRSIRSAYPLHVNYNFDSQGHPQAIINFNSSVARADNPGTYNPWTPAPIIMENKRLDSIEVKAGPWGSASTIRQYYFTYITTSTYYSSDYGGIYYSGKHSLQTITEKDGSGTPLPGGQMSFAYTDVPVSFNDTYNVPYSGNPGNPASLSWPHLQTTTTGYGGSVAYSYTQKPTGSPANIWTRQVVATRTVSPDGSGVNQVYSYDHTGDPIYKSVGNPPGWHNQYRGFSQVRETIAGNYTDHKYYTTGTVEGKDAEKLTGKEYDTKSYNSGGVLLQHSVNTYDWKYSRENDFGKWTVSPPTARMGIAVDANGLVYVAAEADGLVVKYNASTGAEAGSFASSGAKDIAIGPAAFIHVIRGTTITKYSTDGTSLVSWSTGSWGTFDGRYIAIDSSNNVYITDSLNRRVLKFTIDGGFLAQWTGYGSGFGAGLAGIDVDSAGNMYVVDAGNSRIQQFDTNGNFIRQWGSAGTGPGQFNSARGIASDDQGYVYVADYGNGRIQKFYLGVYWRDWPTSFAPSGLGTKAGANGDVALYVSQYYSAWLLSKYTRQIYTTYLSQVDQIAGDTGAPVQRTEYVYDSYGNVVTEYHDASTTPSGSDVRTEREYYPNTSLWIMNKVARETTYAGRDINANQLRKQTLYYYDGNSDWATAPTKGDLTRARQYSDATNYVDTSYQYDTYGNQTQVTDPNGNVTSLAYDTTYHTNVVTKTYPAIGGSSMTETYTWNYGLGKMVTQTGVNGSASGVTFTYDAFGRPLTVIKPGDDANNPTVKYEGYDTWGTVGSQYIKVSTRTSGTDYQWQKFFFDGVGRIIQTQSKGETEGGITYTMVDTKTYNNRGLTDKDYVSQKIDSTTLSGYKAPEAGWKYTTYAYDGLGRVTSQTNPDGTTVSHAFTDWKDTVTDPLTHKKVYSNDAFGRLVKVEEYNDAVPPTVYATTDYTYDVLGNLTQVVSDSGAGHANVTTSISYNWLSRKTSMADSDMGTWYYRYDSNGNLASQVDAKAQAVNMYYDALNRLKGKTYTTGVSDPPNYTRPTDPGSYTVGYTYDAFDGVTQFGKGLRTGMSNSADADAYIFDARGRLSQEIRTIDANYTTSYTYDSSDRPVKVTYPTGEEVTQYYNGRGLPSSLQSDAPRSIVDSASYNNLGQITDMAQLSGVLSTIFGYWNVGGAHDNSNTGYYGRLWEIKSTQTSGNNVRQDQQYTWDAAGHLTQRQDVLSSFTESFTYDFLDRLATASSGDSITFGTSGSGQTAAPRKAAIDASGNIYVADTGHAQIVKYAADGTYIRKAGSSGSGDGQFGTITGIAVDSNGYVYASDMGAGVHDRIQKFDSDLNYVSKFGSHGLGDNYKFFYIYDLAVDSSGNIYVADTFGSKVKKYDANYQFLLSWNPGQPVGLDVDSGGYVYVVVGDDIKKYNGSGTFQETYSGFSGPNDVEVDAAGNMWIADTGFNRIVELDSSGVYLNEWNKAGVGLTSFSGPYGVARGAGKTYVVDTGNSRVQVIEQVSLSQSYDQIGNIAARNGSSYTYGINGGGPHAAGQVGTLYYYYDADGNMTDRGNEAITWDVENRPLTVTGGATFYYDGDGNRVKKVENGETTVYVNRYYEKKLTTPAIETSYYFLGGKLVAMSAKQSGNTVYYLVGQDHLGSTNTVLDSTGALVSSTSFEPFGATRSSTGTTPTDKLFTGQRLDGTGLYFYNARYYDPTIGRFISADTQIQSFADPQALNRYNYVRNNPLKYTDPSGHFWDWFVDVVTVALDVVEFVSNPSWESAGYLAADAALGVVPFVPAVAGVSARAVKAAAKVGEGGEGIWKLSNFERGKRIEKMLQKNLSDTFPKIDKFLDGVATSIKSIDLNAKTYQDIGKLKSKIRGYIDDLAKFEGHGHIKAGDIKSKALDLAVPEGASKAQLDAIQELQEEAAKRGITVDVTVVR